MLTGTTFETVALLTLIAVVHTFVSSFIVARLTAGEKTEARKGIQASISRVFGRVPANDQMRKAA
jgi:hypothetical protein